MNLAVQHWFKTDERHLRYISDVETFLNFDGAWIMFDSITSKDIIRLGWESLVNAFDSVPILIPNLDIKDMCMRSKLQ